MKHRNTVFHQLLKFLPRDRFQNSVDRHKGDYRTRTLSCWDQLADLLFCQVSGMPSLRDFKDSFNIKQASVTYRIATGPQQGRKVFTLQTLPGREDKADARSRVANHAGFSLHAGVMAEALQRDKLMTCIGRCEAKFWGLGNKIEQQFRVWYFN